MTEQAGTPGADDVREDQGAQASPEPATREVLEGDERGEGLGGLSGTLDGIADEDQQGHRKGDSALPG
jgi:hypothetical protein